MTRMLRTNDVLAAVGVSRSTLCRWRETGEFPAPLRLGANSVGWPATVVDDWIARRDVT